MTPTPSDAQPVAIRYRPKDAPAEPWRYTDDDHASVLGVLGERIGLYDIEPLYAQAVLDAERQKREAAERLWYETADRAEDCFNEWLHWKDRAEAAEATATIERLTAEGLFISEQFSGAAGDIVKLRAKIAEQDRAIEHLQANNSSMAERWTKMLARMAELEDIIRRLLSPKAPLSASAIEENGAVIGHARAALTNIEKERDDDR